MKKKFSRMLALLLTAAMLVAGVGIMPAQEVEAADAPGFSVVSSTSEVKPGQEITVELWLDAGSNLTSFAGLYTYDSNVFEYTNVERGPACNNAYASSVDRPTDPGVLPGEVAVFVDNYTTPFTERILVATFTMVVKESAAGVGALTFDFGEGTQMNSEGQEDKIEHGGADISVTDTEGNEINSGIPIIIDLESLALDRTELTMPRGGEAKLKVTATPANALVGKTVEWTTSDDQVVTVDQNGNIKAVGIGEATVTASVEGKTASAHITVNAPLEAINIKGETEGDSASIMKGKKMQLEAVLVPEDATVGSDVIVWSSSNEDAVTVDQTGLVTAIDDGTAIITATLGDVEGTYTITVETVPLTGISIKGETTIHRGETEKLEVIYEPANTTDDRTVTWTSSDENVATVAVDGTVTAVGIGETGIGEAQITAKVGNHTAVCTVYVDAPLEQIIPDDPLEKELVKGQTGTIGYKLDPEDTTDDKTVTFASSDTSVATVNETTGEVTAVKAGTAVITLTGANGITAEVTVTVTEIPINEVMLNKVSAIVEKGAVAELTATVSPADTTDDDKTITWSSSDEMVATVSSETTQSGETVTVTATDKGGKATITAEAWNGTKAECEIIVPVHVETVTLPKSVALKKGETDMLEPSYSPENHDDTITSVKWISNDNTIASVDAEGMVTALKEGSTEITAVVSVIRMGSETPVQLAPVQTTVTVTENHLDAELGNTIAFDKMEDPLLKNQSIDMDELLNLADIIAEKEITDDITIAWESSKEEVAAIDQTGRLTGLAAGKTTITAVITATTGAGETVGTYTVETEVEVEEIPLESIAFDKIIKEMTVGSTETLHIIYDPENTTDTRDVVWSSSDETILTVENGKVTALKAGTATVTAKVGDKEVSCEILVKETPAGQNGQTGGNGTGTAAGAETGDNGAVRTGDPSNIILYMALLAGAVAAIVVIWRKKRSVR